MPAGSSPPSWPLCAGRTSSSSGYHGAGCPSRSSSPRHSMPPSTSSWCASWACRSSPSWRWVPSVRAGSGWSTGASWHGPGSRTGRSRLSNAVSGPSSRHGSSGCAGDAPASTCTAGSRSSSTTGSPPARRHGSPARSPSSSGPSASCSPSRWRRPRRCGTSPEADAVVCVSAPEHLRAVGAHYEDFSPTSDDEVVALLDRAGRRAHVADAVEGLVPSATWTSRSSSRPGRVTIEGHLRVPDGAAGVVLFAHGSGSSRHSPRNRFVADVLHDAGLATLLLDLLTSEEEGDRAKVFDIPLLATASRPRPTGWRCGPRPPPAGWATSARAPGPAPRSGRPPSLGPAWLQSSPGAAAPTSRGHDWWPCGPPRCSSSAAPTMSYRPQPAGARRAARLPHRAGRRRGSDPPLRGARDPGRGRGPGP